jgi:DsbC/DsbD-like thiol-disulfide interchange protein
MFANATAKTGFQRLAATALFMGVLVPIDATTASGPSDVITELKTYVSRDKVHAGETFKAALRLTIGRGWHINANPASDELLIPTSLEIAAGDGLFHSLDFVYPEPRMVRLGFSETDVAIYAENVLLGALVRADDSLMPGTYTLKGTVTWQACTDVSCLPPESREFEIGIVVVPPGRETHDANGEVFEGMKFESSPTL